MAQSENPVIKKLADIINTENYYYIGVKASPSATDCTVYGLNQAEELAISKRFPNLEQYVINGVMLKGTINMEHGHDHHDHNACCNSDNNPGVRQSLSEMEFERGIWYAAQSNDRERVKSLLRRGILADVEDSAGYTALHYAARNGCYEICEILLQNGARVNAQTRSGRATALHRAATQGRANIVEFLLKSGANVNLKDADGYTALHRAVVARSIPVCRLLIPCTDLKLLDNSGRSLERIAEDNCPDILPLLSAKIKET